MIYIGILTEKEFGEGGSTEKEPWEMHCKARK
jgi:hypothetical protein